MYNPIDISSYFLHKYSNQENTITPMKLVKLVYISHGWHLGITGNALIDENPEAWKYGPVIPTIYHYYKNFGRNPIKLKEDLNYNEVLPEEIRSFLDRIWSVYGKFSGIELSAKTHQSGTPWDITWSKIHNDKKSIFGIYSKQIPDNLIKDYYYNKLVLNRNKAELQEQNE